MGLQMFGTIDTGDVVADAMLCIDDDRPDEGMFHWWGGKGGPSGVLARFDNSGAGEIKLEPLTVYSVDNRGGLISPAVSDEQVDHVRGFQATIRRSETAVEGAWRHVSGKHGRIDLKSDASTLALSPEVCLDWNQFKAWTAAARAQDQAVFFRGHGSNKFQLRTTLHRSGRHRLERYCSETLYEFRGHVEALSGQRVKMDDPDDYAMLLGLAQHHGLPTPMLDWTASPYIAAFFAFADALDSGAARADTTHVRVYGLTRRFIETLYAPVVTLPYHRPYISPMVISARNNPRLYAQQGRFLVSNVADIERYLLMAEQRHDQKILVAADVPISCAREALEDLQFMGLSAATMFPGIDGVCKMMRHAMTFRQKLNLPAGRPIGAQEDMSVGSEASVQNDVWKQDGGEPSIDEVDGGSAPHTSNT